MTQHKNSNDDLLALCRQVAKKSPRAIRRRKPSSRLSYRRNVRPFYFPLARCRACNKDVYNTKEEAENSTWRAERKLSVYECDLVQGWHRTSECRKCKCRDVFRNKGQAEAAQVLEFLKSKRSFPKSKICHCEKCGDIILRR